MLRLQDGTIGAEPFWVSVYREGSTSVHGKVLAKASSEHENQVDLEPQGDIEFERQTSVSLKGQTMYERHVRLTIFLAQSSFLVGCSTLNVPKTTLKMPRQTHKSLVSKGVSSPESSYE